MSCETGYLVIGKHPKIKIDKLENTVKSKARLEKLTNFGRKIYLFAAKGPGYHYVYGRWRLSNWLQKVAARSFDLDNITFLTEVDLEKSGSIRLKKAAVKGDADSALADLTAYFRARTRPTFFFSWEDEQELISLIRNDWREATIHAADEVCQNIFRFRRVDPVKFENGIDWAHRPQGNIDWTWDLNRHTYFETLGRAYRYTGEERYGQKFRMLLLDWLAKNPAGVNQPNWTSVFEVAFRINTWLWAFYYFQTAAAFDDEVCLAFLKGLLTHGLYLDAHLEMHAQNNHLLLEAKSLAMLGLLFPEFKAAARWRQRGLKILYQQIEAQICPDGVHGERAIHYHRVIAGELLELLVLLENNQVPVPPEIIEAFSRMIEFELWITKPSGMIPLLGDSALEDTHLRFSAVKGGPVFLCRDDLKSVAPPLDEASIWLLAPKRVKLYQDSPATTVCLNSRPFPEGGYFVMRHGQGAEAAYLAFDCGPFGYQLVPGHGHADALNFELYACGQTLVVDPGIYSTHLGDNWRNFFRGSRAHNTVVVDGQDQSTLVDIWRVYRPAQTTLHQWFSSEHFDFVDGSHNGYERFSEPITHRRQVFFVKPEYWVIIDWLTGRGKHHFDLYFHLMPDIDTQLDLESGILRTVNEFESGLIIAPLATSGLQIDIITGATEPIQGWVSFFSGEKLPAPTLRYRQEAVAPVQFCTVLYPYPAGRNTSVTVSPLDVKINGQLPVAESGLTGLQIETETHLDYLIVTQAPGKGRKVFAKYETDARIIYVRHRKKENNELVKVIMRGGNVLLFQGRSVLECHNDLAKDFILDCQGAGD